MKELLEHPVITSNPYTAWFARGEADDDQVSELLMQFSVFSNHFLVAQVKRMVNAETLEGEEGARHILVSECGVGIDPRSGSPEGKTFATGNAHINWLRETAVAVGLDRAELGKWRNASAATKKFLIGLERSYGSHDGMIGAGASFAIETWAANGIGGPAELERRNFWRQLIDGLERVNERREKPIPLGFFKYHFALESGHGANVQRELDHLRSQPGFDARRFLRGGRLALDAIHTFWLGLDESRRRSESFASVNVAQWAL